MGQTILFDDINHKESLSNEKQKRDQELPDKVHSKTYVESLSQENTSRTREN